MLQEERKSDDDYDDSEDTDQEEEMLLQVKVGRKLYKYKGPKDQQIKDLFDILESKNKKNSYFQAIQYLKVKLEKTENWFETKCRLKRDYNLLSIDWVITLYDFLLGLGFLIIYGLFLYKYIPLLSESKVKVDEQILFTINNLIIYGGIFTVYGMVIIHQSSRALQLMLFLVMVFSQVTALYLVSTGFTFVGKTDTEKFELIFLFSLPVLLFLHWFLVGQVYQFLKKQFGEQKSFFCGVGYCFVGPYYIFTMITSYLFLTDDRNTYTIINTIITIISIPICILFFASWSILHYKMFALPLNNIQQAIIKIKEDILLGFQRPKKIQQEEGKFKKFMKKHVGNITSVIIGSIYLATEYYLVIKFVSQLGDEQIDPKKTVILTFEIVAIPVYVILGIYIAASSRKLSDTFLFIPLFLIALPLLFLYPLSVYLEKQEETKVIAELVLFGPPCSCTVWLLLSKLGIKQRMPFLLSTTFICIFISFPLGLLYPLAESGIYDADTTSGLELGYQILLGIGVGSIFIATIIKNAVSFYEMHQKNKKKNRKMFDLNSMSLWNLQSYGFMMNALGFVFGYVWLIWVFNNAPDHQSEYEKGEISGLLILLPLLFILINCAIRSKSLQIKDKDDDGDDQDDIPYDKDDEEIFKEEEEKKLKLIKLQNNIVKAGLLIPILVFLPLIIVVSDKQLQIMFVVLMFGIPLCFIFYYFFTYIKNYNEQYQNFFTPCMVAFCWFLIFLPFGVFLPVASSQVDNTSEEYGTFMRTVIGSTTILCMIGVTGVTMFIHIILNKIEFERKRKFVIGKVQILLADNSYRSDNPTLAKLYQKYVNSNSTDALLQMLQLQLVPVRRIKDDLTTTPTEFRIVTDKTYTKLNSRKNRQNQPKKNKSWMILCADILCCRIGMDEEQDSDSDNNNNNITDIYEGDDARERMDDFFPKEFKDSLISLSSSQTTKFGLVESLEKNQDDLMMEKFLQSDKNVQKPRHKINSTKTKRFKLNKSDDPDGVKQRQFKYTSHGMEMQQNEEIRIDFMHDVWIEFSNNDDHFPTSLIYNDWLELMRISNIYDPNSEDLSYLDEKNVIRVYDTWASKPWKHGLLVLDLQNFADACRDLAKLIFEEEESDEKAFEYFITDVLYVNLLHNLDGFAINYRPNIRQLIHYNPNKQQELKESPFNSKKKGENNSFQDEDILRLDLMLQPDMPKFDPKKQKPKVVDKNDPNQPQYDIFGRQINTQKQKKKKKNLKPCHIRCLYSFCRCMRKCYCEYPARCYRWVNLQISKCFQAFFEKDQKKNKRKVVTFKGKKQATSWEFITREMIETIIDAEEEYEEIKKKGIVYTMKWDFGNSMVMFAKLSDVFTITLVAFSNGVAWYPGATQFTEEDTQKYAVTDGSIINQFSTVYIVSIISAFSYAYLAKVAQPYVRRDEMGQDKDGNKAWFPHPQFFLTKSLQFLGGSLFMLIMRTFIDSFICVWEGEAPWYLYRDQEIECLSNQHLVLMVGSIIGLIVYYPVSTFMFPNFQFQDKALEIKYDPTFLVVYIQAKLLILGVTSFFKSFGTASTSAQNLGKYMQLGTASIGMFAIAALTVRIQPCLIGWINLFETVLFLIAAILNGVGLMVIMTGNEYLGPFFALPLIIVVIGFSYNIYLKKYKKNKKKKKNHIFDEGLPELQTTALVQGAEGLQKIQQKKQTLLQQYDEDGKLIKTAKELQEERQQKIDKMIKKRKSKKNQSDDESASATENSKN